MLGWPSEEWSSLDPTAQEAETLRAADELSRKTTVFELMLRSHLAEHGARLGAPNLAYSPPAAVVRSHRRSHARDATDTRVWEKGKAEAVDAAELEARRLEERRRLREEEAQEEARRRSRREEEGKARSATLIQARVRGSSERAAHAPPRHTWRFARQSVRAFDTEGHNAVGAPHTLHTCTRTAPLRCAAPSGAAQRVFARALPPPPPQPLSPGLRTAWPVWARRPPSSCTATSVLPSPTCTASVVWCSPRPTQAARRP